MTIHVQRQETPPGMLKKPFLFAEMKKKVLLCKKIEHGVMKKTLLLILLISGLSSVAFSQDTVRYGDPWYQFDPLPHLTENSLRPAASLTILRTCGDLYNVNEPVNRRGYLGYEKRDNPIYGIAVVMDSLPGPEYNFIVTLLRGIEYHNYYLYGWSQGVIIDSCYSEDTIKLCEDPLIKRCRFEYFFDDGTGQGNGKTVSTNCFEFYFDTPFLKSDDFEGFADTFFVGVDMCASDPSSVPTPYYAMPHPCVGDSTTTTFVEIFRVPGTNTPRRVQPTHYISPTNDSYHDYPLVMRNFKYWGGIFPIIERRCSVPRGLTLEADSSSVHWSSDGDAELFQLSICSHMWTDPDDGTIFTTTATSQALPSMSPDSNYYIYLRKACSFRQDTVWSDWSEPIMIVPHPSAGVSEVDTPKLSMELSPNPTDGTVAVRHRAVEGTLSVADLQGRVLLTVPATQHTLDLGPLPQGTYIVTLSTPSGTASQTVIKN